MESNGKAAKEPKTLTVRESNEITREILRLSEVADKSSPRPQQRPSKGERRP